VVSDPPSTFWKEAQVCEKRSVRTRRNTEANCILIG
jgi:hypothetical protein